MRAWDLGPSLSTGIETAVKSMEASWIIYLKKSQKCQVRWHGYGVHLLESGRTATFTGLTLTFCNNCGSRSKPNAAERSSRFHSFTMTMHQLTPYELPWLQFKIVASKTFHIRLTYQIWRHWTSICSRKWNWSSVVGTWLQRMTLWKLRSIIYKQKIDLFLSANKGSWHCCTVE